MEQVKEYVIDTPGCELRFYVRFPPNGNVKKDAMMLMTFASDWRTNLFVAPYCLPADEFGANGHLALSFDLPNHGERTQPFGADIYGFASSIRQGVDPFSLFIEDAKAVIDEIVQLGIVQSHKIAVCGTSRGGYCALRLLAADSRVAKAAAFAPVTDWNHLTEFAAIHNTEAVNSLRLSHFIDGLTHKPLFIAIGHQDTRVSTISCCKFFTQLADQNLDQGYSDSLIEFYCTDDEGHSLGNGWYEKGAEFLLGRKILS